jgi:uncharacterized membrane protein YgcG
VRSNLPAIWCLFLMLSMGGAPTLSLAQCRDDSGWDDECARRARRLSELDRMLAEYDAAQLAKYRAEDRLPFTYTPVTASPQYTGEDEPAPASLSQTSRGYSSGSRGSGSSGLSGSSGSSSGRRTEHVSGYTRADGRYVAPYTRRAPSR